ncbi:MAG: hypothetical protein NTW74_17100 [Acidobacteria bacterium]|nr:hypothetical protein [Acidobacteriota bacterium]
MSKLELNFQSGLAAYRLLVDDPLLCMRDKFGQAAGGGPTDRAKMAEIMRRRGLTPAPPQA